MINSILRIFASPAAADISKLLQRFPDDWAFTKNEVNCVVRSDGSNVAAKLYFILHKSEGFAVSLLSSVRGDVSSFYVPNMTPVVWESRIDQILINRVINAYLNLPDSESNQANEHGAAKQA